MLNIVVLQGRLTDNPQTRSTQGGVTMTNFSLAVDRDYQPGGSERRTDFVDCTAFRNTAGFVERNFHKGQLVCVKGRMESRKWLDKNGQARISWGVSVDDAWFCGDRPAAKEAVDVQVGFEDLPDENGGDLPF